MSELEETPKDAEGPTRGEGEEVAQKLQKKLELLATVTLLTTSAVLRVLEQRRPDAELEAEEWEQLQALRDDVDRALQAIDEQVQRDVGKIVDLEGVRERLRSIRDRVDKWSPTPDGKNAS